MSVDTVKVDTEVTTIVKEETKEEGLIATSS